MNQNREQQSPKAEAQSPVTDSQNGQSTTTLEVEDRSLLDHHHHPYFQDQGNLQSLLHQHPHQQQVQLQHLPRPQNASSSESNCGSDLNRSTDVEDNYTTPERNAKRKSEIRIRRRRIRVTKRITIVKVITITEITRRKGLFYKGPKISKKTTLIAGPTTDREEDTIEVTDSGWITDNENEREDEGDETDPDWITDNEAETDDEGDEIAVAAGPS